MRSQMRQLVDDLVSTFWLLPAALVLAGLCAGESLVQIERAGWVSPWLLNGWLYSGGGSGARTLLGAVASSTIGVAGTIFSITIASLTLASSQMGPRLLSNFTRDRGNQFTLGLYLGTFAFALMVLRSVRGADEGAFIPHLAVTVAIGLAFGCVAMLVFFVHHMAGRINVDTVIDLVHRDLRRAIERLTLDSPEPAANGPEPWEATACAGLKRQGYLQLLDDDALADWAHAHGLRLRLKVRPGDYVFPGAVVAESSRAAANLERALADAIAVGGRRVGAADLEFGVRQLVDVGVRALSPGINDPQTAMAVLDRLGAVLCGLAGRGLPDGHTSREDAVVLSRPAVTYDGLTDAMFTTVRQNAEGSAPVLIRLLEVLCAVAGVERRTDRRASLRRHADLTLASARRGDIEPSAMADLTARDISLRSVLGETR